jgi:DNA-binding LacI/PurR family transcriptional regulator
MNTIGLVFVHGSTPAHTNPFLMMVLDGVLSLATRRKKSTMLCTIDRWEEAEHLPELTDGRCDGVLLLVPSIDCTLPETLRQRKVPFVVVNGQSRTGDAFRVDIDNVCAAREMTEYLLQLGHRRIAFVHQEGEWIFPFAYERLEGYRQAMAARGLYDPDIAKLSWDEAAALDLSSPHRPTALFCAYDDEALRLMENLQRRGVRIPEDMSVVGFDDIPGASTSRPGLTTVRQPMTEIGEAAAQMLLSVIEGAISEVYQECLPTELMVRQSAAAVHT